VGHLLIGADPDQLDALSIRMNAAAQRLGEIRSELESLLRRFEWQGGDASEFRDEWSGRLAPLIDVTGSALVSAAKALAVNANQQREASGDPGASGASGAEPLSALLLSGAGALAHSDVLDTAGKYVGIEGNLVGVAALKHVENVLHGHVTGSLGVLDKVGDTLGVVGLGIDEVTFIGDLASNPHSSDTYNAGVNMAIDSAGLVAGAFFPPAGLAVGLAGFVYANYVEKRFPDLNKDIVDDVGAAGTAVGESFAMAAQTDLKAVDAAGSVLSSGVHGVLSHIHF
jgi:hypothetical protein